MYFEDDGGSGGSDSGGIVIVSDNLHDSSEDVANTYISGSTETAYNGWTSTGYIPVKPNTYYRVKNTPGNNYNAFYKSDKTSAKNSVVIPAASTNDDYILIKTNADTAYVRMSGASSGVAIYEIYEVSMSVPSGSINITSNGTINVSPYETAVIEVGGGITPTGTINITANGTHDVNNYASANVNVEPSLQSKSAIPSETAQTITPDSGYDGLSNVGVVAISSTYVGSGVPRKSSTDVIKSETENGLSITVPIGYYPNDITEIIPNANIEELYVSSYQDGMFDVSLLIDLAGYMSEFEGVWSSISPGEVEGLTIIQSNTVITPTESEQTLVDGTFVRGDNVRIGAISSTYVGSGIDQRDETDLTASGATVTVPAGYYAENESKSVASGSAGTPIATKGSVSNHSVSVTPSVSNTTGYITGGTKTGTAVSVSASELVSGTKSVTANGTEDVTNYASVNVAIPFATFYTGTTDPPSSLGNDGDIYLKVVE